MIDALHRTTLLALYQLTLVIGIILMPVAVVANRGGLTLPVHRIVERLGSAYESSRGV